MDETIRDLERQAASGGPAEQEALAQALARLGREAVRFTGPTAPPEPGHRAPKQVDRAESTVSVCRFWGQSETRNQAATRAFVKRRRRRAARRASRAACRDWELWE